MFKRTLIMFLIIGLLFTGAVFAAEEPSEIEAVLQEMDELVAEDVFEWLISLFDIEHGGFYHAMSSRDNTEFFPDLESTIFGIDMLVHAGILPVDETGKIVDGVLSDEMKSLITEFVLSKQDEEDGYFYHPQWQKSITQSRKNRDLSAARDILRRMGVDPLYTYPFDRIIQEEPGEEDIPPHLRSEEALLNWMNQHWNAGTPYSAGNLFSSARSQIKNAGLLDAAVAFITEKQNPETGLWGDGLNYINSNAAMKLVGFYQESGIPLPHIEKVIESITTIIIEGGEEPGAVVDVWNPIFAINGALDSYETISPELREAIDQAILPLAEISIENIKPFKRNDGGFSYGRMHSSITSQGAYVGYGLEEGDVNATMIATIRLRNSLYQMAGVERPPLYENTSLAAELIDQWESLPPVEKVEKPIGLDEDFENVEPGRLPVRYFATVNGGNQIEVATDPTDSNNQALLIGRNALSTNSRLHIPVESGYNGETPQKTTISMDLMIESPVVGTLFYNRIGNDGIQWVISGHADGFSLSNRRSDSGIGTTFSDRLAYGEWHSLTIEYIPDGKQFTVINYYIDGDLKLSTNEYFNRGNANLDPAPYIDNLRFDNFNAAGIMNMYIDNLRMTVEETNEVKPVGFEEDFEETAAGKLPPYFYGRVGGSNRIEVATDPVNPNNQALLLDRNTLQADTRLHVPVKGGDHPYKTIVSMDLIIQSPVVGTLFYNRIGTDAIQWIISGHQDGFTLSNRRSESGIGTTFTDPLAYGKWHNLRIEYTPGGKQNTWIEYFIDDELVLSTNEYYNRGNAAVDPASSIDNIWFDNFLAAGIMKLYVDNLHMTVEPVSTSSMLDRMDRFAADGAFENNQVVRVLTVHLTAVQVFEKQENGEKVIQHMGGYHQLLDHWQESMTEQAYETLKAEADVLIAAWE